MQCCVGSIGEFVGSLDSPLGSVGVSDGPVATVATQFTHKKHELKRRCSVALVPLVVLLDHWTVRRGVLDPKSLRWLRQLCLEKLMAQTHVIPLTAAQIGWSNKSAIDHNDSMKTKKSSCMTMTTAPQVVCELSKLKPINTLFSMSCGQTKVLSNMLLLTSTTTSATSYLLNIFKIDTHLTTFF